MNLIGKILNRIDVLSVGFASDERMQMFITQYRIRDNAVEQIDRTAIENIASAKEQLQQRILLLAVSGHGIITKPQSATQTMQQATNFPDIFLLTNHDNGTFSIIRKEQFTGIMQQAEQSAIRFADIVCVDELCSINSIIVRFALSNFTAKGLLQRSDKSSLIAQHIIKKIRLPILGLALLILIGNVPLSSSLNTKYNDLHNQCAILEKQANSSADIDEQYKTMMTEFHHNTLSYSYALLADRIAASVPDKLILTQLRMTPVTKRIDELQPVVAEIDKVVINGRASDTNDISDYTRALLENEFIISLELSTVEPEQDSGELRFEIVIEL